MPRRPGCVEAAAAGSEPRRYKPHPHNFCIATNPASQSHDFDRCRRAPAASLRLTANSNRPFKTGFWALTLGCIGVVYGDIGTSPLYAVRESVLAAVGPGNPANETVVFGILSLIIWALLLVVTAKYVLILLRADNNGEGGTLALMALASRALAAARCRRGHPARHYQRRAVLWRRHHHAGAVGAVRGRRPEGRDAGVRRLCRADHGGDPDCAVLGAVARHREGRDIFRPDHADLVFRHRCRRALAYRQQSARAARIQSLLRHLFPPASRHHRIFHARRGVSWSSPARRRSTPISGTSAAARSVLPGWSWCCRR